MNLEEKVRAGLKAHLHRNMPCIDCEHCPYNESDNKSVKTFEDCTKDLMDDYEELISDMKDTIILLEFGDDEE